MRNLSSMAILLAASVGCGVEPRSERARGGAGDGGASQSASDPGSSSSATGPCEGLACRQVQCGELASATTLTGTVLAPNGTLPLYGATIYVPNGPVAALPTGAQCGRCDETPSGNPLVSTTSGPDGRFQLTNVPAGANVPLVIQLGAWRRIVTVDNVPACASTELDKGVTRMPRNASEGDMPHIGIATGALDPMECLLLKVGIDPSEMREPGHGGRVDLYRAPHRPGTSPSPTTPIATDPQEGLLANRVRLFSYDMVLLPCEGEAFDQDAASRKNLADYVDAGGRLFTSHYGYDWLTYPSSPFNKVADPLVGGLWPTDQRDYPADGSGPAVASLDQSSAKGAALARWLSASGASSPSGTLAINELRHDLDGVDPRYAETWATASFGGKPGIAHMSFPTPVGGAACGRVTFSDFHVAASEANGAHFPDACVMSPLTDQERALAFLLFDLASCVQPMGSAVNY